PEVHGSAPGTPRRERPDASRRRRSRRARLGLGGKSRVAIPEQPPSLELVQPAPYSVGLTRAQGVLQALELHGARRADGLGGPLALSLDLGTFQMRWGEEEVGVPT